MASATLHDRADALRTLCLEANLDALSVPERSRSRVREAEATGEFVTLSDGTLAVLHGGAILGAAADEESRKATLEPIEQELIPAVLVYGLGTGHAVRELRERTRARVVVFEPDPGILRTVLSSGPTDLVGVNVVCDETDLDQAWRSAIGSNPSATLIDTPGYAEAFQDQRGAVTKVLEAFVADATASDNTRAARNREWIEHVLANVELLTESSPVLSLQGSLKGVPAFIVGAGPSLSKNAALLSEARKKGLVLAVDVAGRVFGAHGTSPHMLVCLEGQDVSRDLGSLPFIDRIIRACSVCANPRTLRTGQGELMLFYEGMPFLQSLRDVVGVPPVAVGGSVSTVAFSIAEQLGCSPIVLLGQDLAYSDGRTHAAGTMFENSRVRVDAASDRLDLDLCDEVRDLRKGSHLGPAATVEQAQWVDAWGGSGQVASTTLFGIYRRWFEQSAETLLGLKRGHRFVNATEGGSRLRNFEEMRLEDLLKELPERNLDVTDLVVRARDARPRLEHREVAGYAIRAARSAAKASRAARHAATEIDLARQMLSSDDVARINNSLLKVREAEQAMTASCAAQPLVEGWVANQVESISRKGRVHATGDARDDADWALNLENQIAKILEDGARELSGELRKLARQLLPRQAATRMGPPAS
jgi:hypothetical protein